MEPGATATAVATRLRILGAPKPSTTAFYLRSHPARRSAHQQELLYDPSEASLRGRKLYRRVDGVETTSTDPRTGGIACAEGSKQNRTVDLLPKDMTFNFHIDFDNLTTEELGALVFSLDLGLDAEAAKKWAAKDKEGRFHQLGYGKPLGLGRCAVKITGVELDSAPAIGTHPAVAPSARYAALQTTPDPDLTRLELARASFLRAWNGLRNARPLADSFSSLLEMTTVLPPGTPVHYPPHPDGRFTDNYVWFVDNKKWGLTLPQPVAERTTENDRLPEWKP